MKVIITKQQYKNLAFSLLDNIVGDLKLDSEYEQGEAYIKVLDSYGENTMDVWLRKSAIPKGCKKELNVSIETSELIFSYLPLVRKKIFSEVFLEYFYMKTKYKCDCVDFYYPIDKKDENDDFVYRKFTYKKKKKKIKESKNNHLLLGESTDKKQNVFSGQQSNNSLFMFTQTGQKGYYQVIPFNSFTDQFYDYVSSLGKDSESEVMDYLINRTYIEASGEYNRIHFREGLDPRLQGIGLGYKIYKEFIEFLGYGSSSENATTESKRVWKKLLESSDFYGVYGDGENVLIVSKNWKGDVVSLIKSFISKKCQDKVINISNSLLSDYPEFNTYFENPINESIDNSNIVEKILEMAEIKYEGCGFGGRTYDNFGRKVDTVEMYFKFPNESKLRSRSIHFITRNNKVVTVESSSDFRTLYDGLRYIPELNLMEYFIEKAKTYLERILRYEYPSDNLKIQESVDKNKKFLINYLGEDFISNIEQITSTYDVPMSFDDGIAPSTINMYLNHWGPMYLFELDGVKYLYQDRGNFEMFIDEEGYGYVDGEIPEKLGIGVMGLRFSDIIDMFFDEEKTTLNENVDKNKKFLIDYLGEDFINGIEQITSQYDIPYELKSRLDYPTLRRMMNFWGPMYLVNINGKKYLYQDRDDYEWFMDNEGGSYVDGEILEEIGIGVMGLKFSHIIDIFFNED